MSGGEACVRRFLPKSGNYLPILGEPIYTVGLAGLRGEIQKVVLYSLGKQQGQGQKWPCFFIASFQFGLINQLETYRVISSSLYDNNFILHVSKEEGSRYAFVFEAIHSPLGRINCRCLLSFSYTSN